MGEISKRNGIPSSGQTTIDRVADYYGGFMNIINYFNRFFHSPIVRLSTLLLVMLPWSVPAFSQRSKPPVVVSAPIFSGPIHAAAKAGDLEKVNALLKDNPELVSGRDQGWTPLHVAAEFGKKDVAELLLANKADANARDRDGHTPLHYALQPADSDVAESLRRHGGHE
jgi:hypothetical protein